MKHGFVFLTFMICCAVQAASIQRLQEVVHAIYSSKGQECEGYVALYNHLAKNMSEDELTIEDGYRLPKTIEKDVCK